MLLLPLLLQLQIARQLVVGICVGLLRCPFSALRYADGLFLKRVKVGAEVEVVIHGEVLEGILPDFVLSLVASRKDVEVLVLCVLLVNALQPLIVDRPLYFRLGLPEGEIGELLVDEQPAGVLFDKLY